MILGLVGDIHSTQAVLVVE